MQSNSETVSHRAGIGTYRIALQRDAEIRVVLVDYTVEKGDCNGTFKN